MHASNQAAVFGGFAVERVLGNMRDLGGWVRGFMEGGGDEALQPLVDVLEGMIGEVERVVRGRGRGEDEGVESVEVGMRVLSIGGDVGVEEIVLADPKVFLGLLGLEPSEFKFIPSAIDRPLKRRAVVTFLSNTNASQDALSYNTFNVLLTAYTYIHNKTTKFASNSDTEYIVMMRPFDIPSSHIHAITRMGARLLFIPLLNVSSTLSLNQTQKEQQQEESYTLLHLFSLTHIFDAIIYQPLSVNYFTKNPIPSLLHQLTINMPIINPDAVLPYHLITTRESTTDLESGLMAFRPNPYHASKLKELASVDTYTEKRGVGHLLKKYFEHLGGLIPIMMETRMSQFHNSSGMEKVQEVRRFQIGIGEKEVLVPVVPFRFREFDVVRKAGVLMDRVVLVSQGKGLTKQEIESRREVADLFSQAMHVVIMESKLEDGFNRVVGLLREAEWVWIFAEGIRVNQFGTPIHVLLAEWVVRGHQHAIIFSDCDGLATGSLLIRKAALKILLNQEKSNDAQNLMDLLVHKLSGHFTDVDNPGLYTYMNALSRNGLKVVHVDPNETYGELGAVLNLKETLDLSHFEGGEKVEPEDKETLESLLKESRKYCIELSPKLIFSSGDLVSTMIASNVSNYLEFRALEQHTWSGRTNSRPFRALLSQFVPAATTVASEGDSEGAEKSVEEVVDPEEGMPFIAFLEKQGLSTKSCAILFNAIGLFVGAQDRDNITKKEGVEAIKQYLGSIGRFGVTPFLSGVYGTSSEVSQAFCRVCAVHGGTYILGFKPTNVSRVSLDGESTFVVKSKDIDDDSNVELTAKWIITSPSCASKFSESLESVGIRSTVKTKRISRCVAISDTKLENIGEPGLIVIPPKENGKAGAIGLQHSANTLVSPAGKYILYLSMKSDDTSTAREDLEGILKTVLSAGSARSEEGNEMDSVAPLATVYVTQTVRDSDVQHGNDRVLVTSDWSQSISFEENIKEAKKLFESIVGKGVEFMPAVEGAGDDE
ncbi:hypothetical protein BCR33DRAFT_857535 [Rhizoclosmatium globosum]|uniref:Uncharacterized protein n=1 Tax=Rhizoclosmatium globosum TaxID=329046 RepID=A0A1Y2B5E2_9FUNG|nr:hypothetical protein BCR33DRAFT_857535 [Rhizoclosmatium globosum]|eukprot:ORY29926.1 hypothetical protein BCR33DRAFT_857535 [Rhizoclosmatium globosum]